MLGLVNSSNCSAVFDFDSLLGHRNNDNRALQFNFPRFNISVPPIEPADIKLRAVNIGSGTSGTRSINELVCCHFSLATIHWTSSCNDRKTPGYAKAFMSLIMSCTKDQNSANCESWKILALYGKALYEILTTYEFASDFPIAESFPDLLHFVPDMSVIYSVRHPSSWVKSRISEHGSSPICHPRLWNHPNVLHPFDIIGCIASTRHVHDALIPQRKLSTRGTLEHHLQQAYLLYNQFNVHFLQAHRIPVMVICLWDVLSTRDRDLIHILQNHWETSLMTAPLLGRKAHKECPKTVYRTPSKKNIDKIMTDVATSTSLAMPNRLLLSATQTALSPVDNRTNVVVLVMISLIVFWLLLLTWRRKR